MQKLVVCSVWEIDKRINENLHAGWTVVPGTLVLQSLEQARPKLSNDPATPSNTIFKTHVAVVLQRAGNYEAPEVITSQDDEVLKQMGTDGNACPSMG